jgi:uncharacterized protein (DUF4415 family)
MAKKSSTSSRREKSISVNSDVIWSKPRSKRDEAVAKRIAAEQARGDFSNINYKDIPGLTDEQLASAVRARDRPPRKIPVNVRLDPAVLAWLRGKGEGHLTRINDILANVMEAELRL